MLALAIWLTGRGHANAERPLGPLAIRFGPSRVFDEAEALAVSGNTLWVARWLSPDSGAGVLLVPLRASTLAPAGAPIALGSPLSGATLAAAGGVVYVRTGGRTGRIAGGRVVWLAASAIPRAVAERLLGTPGLGLAWGERGRKLVATDPATGVRRMLPLVSAVHGSRVSASTPAPAVAAGLVWVAEWTDSNRAYLEAVRPGGGAARPPLALGHGIPVLVLAAAGRLWVAVNDQGPFSRLWQVDPNTGRVIGRVRMPADFLPMFAVAAGHGLWLGEQQPDGRVYQAALSQPSA